jgi:hypothetical protein
MKVISAIIALFLTTSVFSQNDSTYCMKWKIQPDQAIRYNTYMVEMDTSESQAPSFNMDGLSKMLRDSSAKKHMDAAKQFFSRVNKSVENDVYVTMLTEKKPGIINIEMRLKSKPDSTADKNDTSGSKEFTKLMRLMSGSVTLRGTITEGGAIESFYLRNDQKNLIALWYELPNKAVKIGDSWPLEIHLISMDQNFKCDSSFRINKVTLTAIHKSGNQTVAVLNYDVEEYVVGDFSNPFAGNEGQKTMMKATYKGVSEFSIEKGRWISYDGIMAISSSGVMTSKSEKKFSLIAN